ncbi:16S rRNA (adenine(1518)-N(6)/adenine(1519)-N(6))-dimethyltransferase RsmA [Candidatus Bipolaricaulota bacterium]|nr:16S rRNA (adenine(1518)-N(6)/adenine(1519)-N(6))-dimethyltransferase RsmA [Candidatus Bipolaricaulota bacterium]
MPIEDLSSHQAVVSLLRKTGVRPSKRLGQSFLVDRAVLDTILSEAILSEAIPIEASLTETNPAKAEQATPEEFLEIGAGLGTVTRKLAGIGGHVVAVEIDRRLVQSLKQTLGDLENVEIVRQDILDFDLSKRFAERSVFVVGNIPYRITAPILKHLVAHRNAISGALLLTQREVAEKIAASPGRDGSALGVFLQAYTDICLIRQVAKRSFYPVPAVDSLLWRLSFLPKPRFTADADTFFTVVRALYGKRRKMARSALRDLFPAGQASEALRAAGIDPAARGETLTMEELDHLARLMHKFQDPENLESRGRSSGANVG